jgi:hypothetical protein
MRSRSINIFLLDGEPDGIRVAQISMSTIQAIAFRKLQLKTVRGKFPEELSHTGVYLLLGFDEDQPDRLIAYVGQSECVGDRLQYHASNDKANESKAFWVDTIVMVSKDENLTASHARYVEARLIANAGTNPRWTLRNSQKAPEEGKLPLPEREAMEEYIDQTRTLVGALGCDLFKVVAGNLAGGRKKDEEPRPSPPEATFHFKGQGFEARMSITPSSELVVQKGSKCRLKTANTIPEGVAALRTDLQEKHILVEKDGALSFTSDYIFPSVSTAAATVGGASINGRSAWKLADGKTTFAQWENAHNISPTVQS